MKDKMVAMVKRIQDEICEAIEARERVPFHEDKWKREGGGGGRTRVIQGGSIFEKAGVNVSQVYGTLSPEAASEMGGGHDSSDLSFFATGVSLVMHPNNPFVPTVHANFRYFERGDGSSWWFGGGADLTPSYLFEEDATHFHQTFKNACDLHDAAYYPKFKKWCDEYFYIKHRGESRGVGGIFFDNHKAPDAERAFSFTKDCADAFLPSYLPILDRRLGSEFTSAQKDWQQIRRGRYVEFNLVYDRGTKFGLNTQGRIESILMSLPLTSRWEYCHETEKGSAEEALVDVLKNPREWAP